MRPIDADALITSLKESYGELRKIYDGYEEGTLEKEVAQAELITFLEAILRTDGMPTLDYEPVRHGEWIESTACVSFYECSQCRSRKRGNQPFFDSVWNFCPNCGAKMDGGKSDG